MFSSPEHPDQVYGTPSLMCTVSKAFPRGQSGWDMKITTHIIPVPKLGMSVAILPFPNTPSCHVD